MISATRLFLVVYFLFTCVTVYGNSCQDFLSFLSYRPIYYSSRLSEINPKIDSRVLNPEYRISSNLPIFGNKFAQKLPPLSGPFLQAFEGAPSSIVLEPGQMVWQVQRSLSSGNGRWFSNDVPKDGQDAEGKFNILKWGNDAGQISFYFVKERVSAYFGRVAGGKGTQIFIPDSVPLEPVLKRISFNFLGESARVLDVGSLKKGTPVLIAVVEIKGSVETLVSTQTGYFSSSSFLPGGRLEVSYTTGSGIAGIPETETQKIRVFRIHADLADSKTYFSGLVYLGGASYDKWVEVALNTGTEETRIRAQYKGRDESRTKHLFRTSRGEDLVIPVKSIKAQVPVREISVELAETPFPQLSPTERYVTDLLPNMQIQFQLSHGDRTYGAVFIQLKDLNVEVKLDGESFTRLIPLEWINQVVRLRH